MGTFKELPEHHLDELSDEQLVDYLRAAREAGADDAIKAALAVLVYGYLPTLMARARLKLPPSEVEDVASETMISAVLSAFDGKSVGEFRAWMHTIMSRRIADHLESKKRKLQTEMLASEHQGADDVWGDEPFEEFTGEALYAAECVKRAYREIENPTHRRVLDVHVFGALSAADAAVEVGDGMSEANVHQIASRYQKRVRQLLDEGDTAG